MNDSDMLHEYNIMNPNTLLRVARLQLLGRLALKAPAGLMSVVRDMSVRGIGWAQSVGEDLKRLSLNEAFTGCSEYNLADWIQCIFQMQIC